jgi:tetratricopeptide (TPR) repeat protein
MYSAISEKKPYSEQARLTGVPAQGRSADTSPRAWLSTALLVLLLAGCATQSTDEAAQQPTPDDKSTASQLYAGQPAVVHATEFPVASAAEGVQRGDEAWRQGKLDLAVYLYVQALAFDATAPAPLLKIGTIHEQLGNRALAEKAYGLALERDPGNAAACERLGLLYLESARNDEARALFDRAIAVEPNRWRSENGLGIVADRRKDFAAAIAHYDRALALEPKAAPVMNNRGYSRFLAGDLAGAEADLQEAIRLGARDGAWRNLGRVQARQARYAEALESFLQEADLANAYNLLGEAAMERGDYLQARKYFESASSASPRYFEAAQRNLGIANERLATTAPAVTAPKVTNAIKVVLADTSVFMKGVIVGTVKRGDRVPVLKTQDAFSQVGFRDSGGTERVGWVPSSSLADSP